MTFVAKANAVTADRPLSGHLFRVVVALRDRVSLRKTDKSLARLSPHLLRDIGLPPHFGDLSLKERRSLLSPESR